MITTANHIGSPETSMPLVSVPPLYSSIPATNAPDVPGSPQRLRLFGFQCGPVVCLRQSRSDPSPRPPHYHRSSVGQVSNENVRVMCFFFAVCTPTHVIRSVVLASSGGGSAVSCRRIAEGVEFLAGLPHHFSLLVWGYVCHVVVAATFSRTTTLTNDILFCFGVLLLKSMMPCTALPRLTLQRSSSPFTSQNSPMWVATPD